MFAINLSDPFRKDIQVGETFLSYIFGKFFCRGFPELMVITHRTSIGGERAKPGKAAAQGLLHSEGTKPANSAVLAN
jgi:hypothetical protein